MVRTARIHSSLRVVNTNEYICYCNFCIFNIECTLWIEKYSKIKIWKIFIVFICLSRSWVAHVLFLNYHLNDNFFSKIYIKSLFLLTINNCQCPPLTKNNSANTFIEKTKKIEMMF
jgi:hypothetical protein